MTFLLINSGVYVSISTHTLTWSVTWFNEASFTQSINFNSHAHVERDIDENTAAREFKNFNSHAHVERDHQLKQQVWNQEHFNSHAHVERDVFIEKILRLV